MSSPAIAAYLESDLPKAFDYSSKAVLLFRRIQNKLSLAEVLITMGQILAKQGKTLAAAKPSSSRYTTLRHSGHAPGWQGR